MSDESQPSSKIIKEETSGGPVAENVVESSGETSVPPSSVGGRKYKRGSRKSRRGKNKFFKKYSKKYLKNRKRSFRRKTPVFRW
jgi:hypothetical protein